MGTNYEKLRQAIQMTDKERVNKGRDPVFVGEGVFYTGSFARDAIKRLTQLGMDIRQAESFIDESSIKDVSRLINEMQSESENLSTAPTQQMALQPGEASLKK